MIVWYHILTIIFKLHQYNNHEGEMKMDIIQASMNDLDGIMSLHRKYHIDSIDMRDKPDGFVTTNFTPEQLEVLVMKEHGITIAKQNGVVVSYAMAASWQFWSEWPFFSYMIEQLPNNSLGGQTLSVENSYQYGPICVDTSVRGTGVFEKVFHSSLEHMLKRFPIMVTFVNQVNHHSYAAHTRKVSMTTVGTFQYNNNDYYMLACPTKGTK